MRGQGKVSVAGGAGYTRSGSGSGGYISLHYTMKFGAIQFETTGGQVTIPGASGILYEASNGKRTVLVSGYSRTNIASTVIACDAGTSIEFSTISLTAKARLSIQICALVSKRVIFTDVINGDQQTELTIGDGQQVYVAYKGESSYDLSTSIHLLSGGLLQVPTKFSVMPFVKLFLGGQLVGGSYFTLQPNSQLTVRHPGFSSYVDLSISRFSFTQLVIEPRASVVKQGVNQVHFDVVDYELQYNGVFSSSIPLVVTRKNDVQSAAASLPRASCPHGHEIVDIASEKVYDPCGTGKLIYAPRNVSYQVNVTRYRNVSYIEIHSILNVTTNTTRNMTSIKYKMAPYLVEVTRYKIVYNITCNYDKFTLLVGQKCNLAPGKYKYKSLIIQQMAEIRFESNGTHENVLTVGDLTIRTDGKITVLPHSVPDSSLSATDAGGSYGGLGGAGASRSGFSSVTGSVMRPTSQGQSGGGGGSGQIGKGGGQLRLIIDSEMINDGYISVDGGDGIGGGSGGSLLVDGGTIKGRGIFSARGGAGRAGSGGGGGGGRIAIYSNNVETLFKGTYSVRGGSGYAKGQPGTVIFATTLGAPLTKLYLKEEGKIEMPSGLGSLFIDMITLGPSVELAIKNITLKTQSLVTSDDCFLDIHTGAAFIVNSTESHVMKCRLNVQQSGILSFAATMEIASSISNSDVISGQLTASTLTIYPGKTLDLIQKGWLRVNKLYLGRNSKLSMSIGSQVGNTSSNQINLEQLHLSMAATIYVSSSNLSLSSRILHMAQSARLTYPAELDLSISSNEITIENQASLTAIGSPATSVSLASSSASCGFGGSHGGQGGGDQNGKPYGGLVRPRSFGSSGGNLGGSVGSVGGGIITIDTKSLNLNGILSVSGSNSVGSHGGGSGGSLLITAETLTGHGTMSANGGDSLCGGGSGGRVALHVKYRTTFTGSISAYGGKGSHPGAAGTVFISEKVVGIDVNTTIIHNNGVKTASESNIAADGAVLSLQNLVISGQGKLSFSTHSSPGSKQLVIKFSKVSGDLSGLIRVIQNQAAYLQTSQAYSERPFMLPCSLSVGPNATLFLSSRLFVTNTINQPSLYIAGIVVGGENIIAGKQGEIVITRSGRIGIPTGQPQTYSFRTISVLNQGVIKFESSSQEIVEVNSESISVGYGGKLEGTNLRIKTPSLTVAYNGRITTDGKGYAAGSGPGAGNSVVSGGASGGSYGGFSGAGSGASATKVVYGSLFKASLYGSGGGNSGLSKGGSGGGTLTLQVTSLRLDGIISANGASGGSNAGAGSGGSIHVQSSKFAGLGILQVLGGQGLGKGGSGSGGRVSVVMDSEYSFSGIIDATGGVKLQGSSANGYSGSPGTVYIKDIYNTFFQREKLIIHNRLNLNYIVDTALNQTVASHKFDRLIVKGKVKLHVDKNSDVKKLESDDQSVLHVPDYVILTVEQMEAESSIHASFHVDKFGEIRLASKVTFLGLDNRLLGTLTGVFDFNIGETKTTTLSASGRTAHFKDGKYVLLSNRGEYKFIKVTLQNRAKLSFEDSSSRVIPISLASLEMHYGSILSAPRLLIDSGDITVHIGAKVDVSGTSKNSTAARIADGGNACGYGGGRDFLQNRTLSSVQPNLTGEAGGGNSMGGIVAVSLLFLISNDVRVHE